MAMIEDVQRLGNDFIEFCATSCTFTPENFIDVMDNLLLNPNITSSHLFRADIFYDSDKDYAYSVDGSTSAFLEQLHSDFRPRMIPVPGFKQRRVVVRQLIPRNTNLDKPLLQTCQFLEAGASRDPASEETNLGVDTSDRTTSKIERNAVLYIPHVQDLTGMPYYHPKVRKLAFLHEWTGASPHDLTLVETKKEKRTARIAIHVQPFPAQSDTEENRIRRTLENLLSVVLKHGTGNLTGYTKRSVHDTLIPQARLQNTYTRLKNAHAKVLLALWREQTDATKSVFEDLGIAAFLLELWRDTYAIGQAEENKKPKFPGFVDIACGNGALVYVLIQEGFCGWGFDARSRRTWQMYPQTVQCMLKERVYVPAVLQDSHNTDLQPARLAGFPIVTEQDFTNEQGKALFIISNHADELTCWTPLIASHLNTSFIAIPCCSHDLCGAKTRYTVQPKSITHTQRAETVPDSSSGAAPDHRDIEQEYQNDNSISQPKTGCLKKTSGQASTYSSLCTKVTQLSEDVGFIVETEMLRIPSTRNFAVVGRKSCGSQITNTTKSTLVRMIIERETKRSIALVRAEWLEKAQQLVQNKGRNH